MSEHRHSASVYVLSVHFLVAANYSEKPELS